MRVYTGVLGVGSHTKDFIPGVWSVEASHTKDFQPKVAGVGKSKSKSKSKKKKQEQTHTQTQKYKHVQKGERTTRPVNSSARHCKRCQSKIQDAVRAVDTGGVGAAVDTSAGGGDTDAVHDLARATSDVLGLQLLQRNMWLQRALKQSRKELDRHVCVYVTSYALLPSFSLSPSVLFRSLLCVRAL